MASGVLIRFSKYFHADCQERQRVKCNSEVQYQRLRPLLVRCARGACHALSSTPAAKQGLVEEIVP